MIGVTGYLYNRKHKGNDGVEREVTELNVDDISFSSSKSKTQETPSGINSDGSFIGFIGSDGGGNRRKEV